MLWEDSSVVAVVAAVVVLARYFLDNFSNKSSFFVIFYQKLSFCDIFFLKVVFFFPRIFAEGMPARTLVLFILEKICIFYQIVIILLTKTVISGQKLTLQAIFCLTGHFSAINFRRRHVPPHFSACFDRGPFNHIQGHFLLKFSFLPPRIYGQCPQHPELDKNINKIHITIYINIYIYIYPYRIPHSYLLCRLLHKFHRPKGMTTLLAKGVRQLCAPR